MKTDKRTTHSDNSQVSSTSTKEAPKRLGNQFGEGVL